MKKLIKTKKRVADHGEVFTNQREVDSMLNLVENECERLIREMNNQVTSSNLPKIITMSIAVI